MNCKEIFGPHSTYNQKYLCLVIIKNAIYKIGNICDCLLILENSAAVPTRRSACPSVVMSEINFVGHYFITYVLIDVIYFASKLNIIMTISI